MPNVGPQGYAFLGLSMFVALLVVALAFSLIRFVAVTRRSRSHLRESKTESALLSAALEEAIGKLKAQERATAARAEASERLSSEIVASLTSGLLVVGEDGILQIVNPAARRILGRPEAAAGAPAAALLHDAPALADLIDAGLRTARPIVRQTIRLEAPEGPSYLGVSISPLPGPWKAPRSSVVCLFTDLTAVVALEEQLRLKEALARLGELTAGLAHEFRNGLATIHGYARLLDPALLPEPSRRCVEGIRDETRAMGEVVTNFLNFARPEPLTLSPLDLEVVVRRAAEDLPAGARIVIDGEFGEVEGDEVLLRRALGNLMRNAVEACELADEGEVIVSGDRSPELRRVRVSVRDNGPGLSPAALPKLFTPFFTTKGTGTGLGLAIVQKVIVSHNGQVTARNHPSGGAEFRITLPIAAASPPMSGMD